MKLLNFMQISAIKHSTTPFWTVVQKLRTEIPGLNTSVIINAYDSTQAQNSLFLRNLENITYYYNFKKSFFVLYHIRSIILNVYNELI